MRSLLFPYRDMQGLQSEVKLKVNNLIRKKENKRRSQDIYWTGVFGYEVTRAHVFYTALHQLQNKMTMTSSKISGLLRQWQKKIIKKSSATTEMEWPGAKYPTSKTFTFN